MNKIYNGTPHTIDVIENSFYDYSIRKYIGGQKKFSIPVTGILNAAIQTVELPPMDSDGNDIPVYFKSIKGIDRLPEGYDVYIVSAIFANAARQTDYDMTKIFTIADPVYSEDGKTILGCRGICPAF
jgi:hypothetical protein